MVSKNGIIPQSKSTIEYVAMRNEPTSYTFERHPGLILREICNKPIIPRETGEYEVAPSKEDFYLTEAYTGNFFYRLDHQGEPIISKFKKINEDSSISGIVSGCPILILVDGGMGMESKYITEYIFQISSSYVNYLRKSENAETDKQIVAALIQHIDNYVTTDLPLISGSGSVAPIFTLAIAVAVPTRKILEENAKEEWDIVAWGMGSLSVIIENPSDGSIIEAIPPKEILKFIPQSISVINNSSPENIQGLTNYRINQIVFNKSEAEWKIHRGNKTYELIDKNVNLAFLEKLCPEEKNRPRQKFTADEEEELLKIITSHKIETHYSVPEKFTFSAYPLYGRETNSKNFSELVLNDINNIGRISFYSKQGFVPGTKIVSFSDTISGLGFNLSPEEKTLQEENLAEKNEKKVLLIKHINTSYLEEKIHQNAKLRYFITRNDEIPQDKNVYFKISDKWKIQEIKTTDETFRSTSNIQLNFSEIVDLYPENKGVEEKQQVEIIDFEKKCLLRGIAESDFSVPNQLLQEITSFTIIKNEQQTTFNKVRQTLQPNQGVSGGDDFSVVRITTPTMIQKRKLKRKCEGKVVEELKKYYSDNIKISEGIFFSTLFIKKQLTKEEVKKINLGENFYYLYILKNFFAASPTYFFGTFYQKNSEINSENIPLSQFKIDLLNSIYNDNNLIHPSYLDPSNLNPDDQYKFKYYKKIILNQINLSDFQKLLNIFRFNQIDKEGEYKKIIYKSKTIFREERVKKEVLTPRYIEITQRIKMSTEEDQALIIKIARLRFNYFLLKKGFPIVGFINDQTTKKGFYFYKREKDSILNLNQKAKDANLIDQDRYDKTIEMFNVKSSNSDSGWGILFIISHDKFRNIMLTTDQKYIAEKFKNSIENRNSNEENNDWLLVNPVEEIILDEQSKSDIENTKELKESILSIARDTIFNIRLERQSNGKTHPNEEIPFTTTTTCHS